MPPYKSLLAHVAEGYRNGKYGHAKLAQYYGVYLPNYYDWVAENEGDVQVDVAAIVPPGSGEEIIGLAISPMAQLATLLVEDTNFRREFARLLPFYGKLCITMETASLSEGGRNALQLPPFDRARIRPSADGTLNYIEPAPETVTPNAGAGIAVADPFSDGIKAHSTGQPWNQNPYPEDSDGAAGWLAGWNHARDRARAEKAKTKAAADKIAAEVASTTPEAANNAE